MAVTYDLYVLCDTSAPQCIPYTALVVDVRGFIPSEARDSLFSMSSVPVLWLNQPPIQEVQGILSPGVTLPGLEADHSPPTSTEV
jgi:hypothetical protein